MMQDTPVTQMRRQHDPADKEAVRQLLDAVRGGGPDSR